MPKNTIAAKQQKPYPFWLGGAAASMAACCTHPLDVMRVRMQTAQVKKSFFGAIKDTYAHKGIRGFYTGLTASIMRQMTYSLARFGVYDELKNRMSSNGTKKLTMSELVLASSVAGVVGGVAGNPADIILVRMIADPTKPPAQQLHYRNALHGLWRMVSSEGVGSLFRGLLPNSIRAALMNSSQLVSYDVFKASLLDHTSLKDGPPVHFIASALAGTVATTICAPADVIKSRVMNSSEKVGIARLISSAVRKEGVGFLFKGWTPAWIRLTPNTIFVFVFLEQLRHIVDIVRG